VRVLVQALVAAPGGSVTVLRDLVAAWPADDDLLVVCWRDPAAETLATTGKEVIRMPARSTEEALLRLQFRPPPVIRSFRPDVVWSQAVWAGGFSAPQAVHYRDIGSFVAIHPSTARQRLKALRERRDLRHADLLIYNSSTMREAVHSRYPVAATRPNVVIHNGLDLTPFQETRTDSTTKLPNAMRRSILLPQSDAPHKRNWLAAEVLALLRDRAPDAAPVRLTVVGRGEYRDLRARLEHHGLEGATVFTGYVSREEMGVLYASHEVVLMTARAESFGNPIVEAHAAGRPVVTPPFPVALELGGPLSRIAIADDARSLVDAVELALDATIDAPTLQEALEFAERFTASRAAQCIAAELGTATQSGRAGRGVS
jgi:glycosyltransferase involved in cell wall biosynthesis